MNMNVIDTYKIVKNVSGKYLYLRLEYTVPY